MFRRLLPGKATIGKIRSYSFWKKSQIPPPCDHRFCPGWGQYYGKPLPNNPRKYLPCITVVSVASYLWLGYYQVVEKDYPRVPNHVLMKNRSSAGEEKSTKK